MGLTIDTLWLCVAHAHDNLENFKEVTLPGTAA